MSSSSPNFNLTLPTSTDTVSVAAHIAGNLSSIDSILAVAHTGGGALKPGLTIQTPTITSPTLTGGSVIPATLGTPGYLFPSTIGGASEVLTVNAGTVSWQPVSAPGTGADVDLSNLAAVSINTSLNNFTAGTVVFNSVKATAGTFSGLTSIAATTGNFNVLLATAGTLSGLTSVAATTANFTSVTAAGIQMVANITTFSTDGTFSANSDVKVPTEKAIGTFIANQPIPGLVYIGSGSASTGNGAGYIISQSMGIGETYRVIYKLNHTTGGEYGVVTAKVNSATFSTTVPFVSSSGGAGQDYATIIAEYSVITGYTSTAIGISFVSYALRGATVSPEIGVIGSPTGNVIANVGLQSAGGPTRLTYQIYKYRT